MLWPMSRVLILHGWTNRRPAGHWQRRLAGALRDDGHLVQYPQLPDPDHPSLAAWVASVTAELDLLHESGHGETIVVAHSLGCVAWLQSATQGRLSPPVDRALLVAPAAPEVLGDIAEFILDLHSPEVREAAHSAARSTTLVGSDADPWLPRGVQATYGDPLGLTATVLPGAQHLALGDGWGPWQGVIDWVADPAADLSRR